MEQTSANLNNITESLPCTRLSKPDPLNAEFVYYSSVLKVLAPAVSDDAEKQLIIPWVRKLFRPEYHSSKFKEKRNRYLLYLTLSLLNDEAFGIFRTPPPSGALMEIHELQQEPSIAAEWESDSMWRETLMGLPDDFQSLECSVHTSERDCRGDHQLDRILDQEFQFLLYLARPFAAMLSSADDRTRVATWLQMLCTIQGDACSSMRGIRNDYIMALLGYINDLRVVGPFTEYPPWRTLPPLAEAAKLAADTSRPFTDPAGPETNDFMSTQPIPNDGAFCYIAITGDLISSSFGPSCTC